MLSFPPHHISSLASEFYVLTSKFIPSPSTSHSLTAFILASYTTVSQPDSCPRLLIVPRFSFCSSHPTHVGSRGIFVIPIRSCYFSVQDAPVTSCTVYNQIYTPFHPWVPQPHVSWPRLPCQTHSHYFLCCVHSTQATYLELPLPLRHTTHVLALGLCAYHPLCIRSLKGFKKQQN